MLAKRNQGIETLHIFLGHQETPVLNPPDLKQTILLFQLTNVSDVVNRLHLIPREAASETQLSILYGSTMENPSVDLQL